MRHATCKSSIKEEESKNQTPKDKLETLSVKKCVGDEPPLKVTRMVLQFDEEYEADGREVADKTQPLHGVEFK